jgi:hypothetical protein
MNRSILRSIGVAAILMYGMLITQAQQPTPVTVQLSTATPLPLLGGGSSILASSTPVPTETPVGGAELEAITESNVRSDASTEADRLGVIVPGERYLITGRYFRWLQFRYPNSPSGFAWVYDELVTITGDQSLIPDLSVEPPTPDPAIAASTQTAAAILAVPGGDMTATAGARILEGPVSVDGNAVQGESLLNPQGDTRLPTFTPAPAVNELVAQSAVVPTATQESNFLDRTVNRGTMPPLIPIAALIGFGMLGLVASFMRR